MMWNCKNASKAFSIHIIDLYVLIAAQHKGQIIFKNI